MTTNDISEHVDIVEPLKVVTPPDAEATVELTVSTSSQPASISWYHATTKLAQTNLVVMKSDGTRHTLTLKDVKAENSGEYVFVADDASSSVVLTIPGEVGKKSIVKCLPASLPNGDTENRQR